MVFAPKEVRNLQNRKHNVRKYDEVPSHECYVTSNNRQICINTCTLLYTKHVTVTRFHTVHIPMAMSGVLIS